MTPGPSCDKSVLAVVCLVSEQHLTGNIYGCAHTIHTLVNLCNMGIEPMQCVTHINGIDMLVYYTRCTVWARQITLAHICTTQIPVNPTQCNCCVTQQATYAADQVSSMSFLHEKGKRGWGGERRGILKGKEGWKRKRDAEEGRDEASP